MPTPTPREQLHEVLRTKAVTRLPEPVELSSGAMSSEFVDGKEGLEHWEDLQLAGQVMAQTLADAGIEFDAVGGLTMGADALAVAVAAAANCRWFFIRKEPKGRGTGRQIEGAQIGAGDRVVLVDDAVTSAGSILQAHDVAVAAGATAVAAVTLVDRGTVGAPKFDAINLPYFAMATYDDLHIPPLT